MAQRNRVAQAALHNGAAIRARVGMICLLGLIVLGAGLVVGCSPSFEARFERVEPEMDQMAVLDLLGEPTGRRRFVLVEGLFGPGESLYGVVELGTEGEAWSWRIGGESGMDYYVFFGPDEQVLTKEAYPADAIF